MQVIYIKVLIKERCNPRSCQLLPEFYYAINNYVTAACLSVRDILISFKLILNTAHRGNIITLKLHAILLVPGELLEPYLFPFEDDLTTSTTISKEIRKNHPMVLVIRFFDNYNNNNDCCGELEKQYEDNYRLILMTTRDWVTGKWSRIYKVWSTVGNRKHWFSNANILLNCIHHT